MAARDGASASSLLGERELEAHHRRSARGDRPGVDADAVAVRRTTPRVAVYAIARNEEDRVEAWAASAKDADVRVIADTGSTDRTVERARALGITVHEIRLEPFRFDEARNRALDLLPETVDLCVPLDLDEELVSGWREQLDDAWRAGATRVVHTQEWPASSGWPARRFNERKIHARLGYRWRSPVHEQVVADSREVVVRSGVVIRHLRDAAAPRPDYLPLLRLGVAEAPSDGRMAHMLADELCRHGQYEEARREAHRALELELSSEERKLTLLMVAQLEPDRREHHILTACAEFPASREPWCALAQWHAEHERWRSCRGAAMAALRISAPEPDDYLVNLAAWGDWPDELAAQACEQLGSRTEAAFHRRRSRLVTPDHISFDSSFVGPASIERIDLLALAEAMGYSEEQCLERLMGWTPELLADEWRRAAPSTAAEIHEFYATTEGYVWELFCWHGSAAYDPYRARLDAIARRWPPGEHPRVLDYGAGIGTAALLLAAQGYEVTIAEVPGRTLDVAQARFARRGLPVEVIPVTAASHELPNERWDIAVCFDVLEHLPDPGAIARELVRAVRPGGGLAIVTAFDLQGSAYPQHLEATASRFGGGRWAKFLAELDVEDLGDEVYRRAMAAV